MIGERVQDVQRQLDINGAAVRVDEASQQYLDEWQNEQINAYTMFEALVDEGVRKNGQENSMLMKNKNRVSYRKQSNTLFTCQDAPLRVYDLDIFCMLQVMFQ